MTDNKVPGRMQRNQNPPVFWWEGEMCSCNPTPRASPNSSEETGPHKSLSITCTAARVTVAKKWKQPKCPSMDKRIINDRWSVHAMEYHWQ